MLPLLIAAAGSILVGASLRGDAIGSNILKQAKNEPAYHIEGQELVSVVIPTYYEGDYIEDMLEAVRHQTYTPIEIIVSDATQEIEAIDETRQFADEVDAELVHTWVKNVALGTNLGAEQATGDILVFVDADCIMPNDFVEKLVNGLHREGVHLSHGVDVYQPKGASTFWQAGRVVWTQAKPNTYTSRGVAMYAKDFWLVGAYDESLDPMKPHQRHDKDLGRKVAEMWGPASLYIDRSAILAEAPRRPNHPLSLVPPPAWPERAWRNGKAID